MSMPRSTRRRRLLGRPSPDPERELVGGPLSSTFLSLVVVPVFFLAIENAKAKIRRWTGRSE